MTIEHAMGIAKAFEELGVKVDKVTEDCVYISVPKSSSRLDAKGNPMCGKHLARRVRDLMSNLSGGKYTVKFKTY